jgi:tryptophanyl-tRNA synthetase
MACGIDTERSVLFVQSHVSTHAELAWLLGCYTPYGELGRMTQFKDKSKAHPENINSGLYTYPVLQVADILLYQAALVPVGEDKRQHLELSRNVAIRFNGIYGDMFVVPEAYIPKEGGKVMSLQEPAKKISKSDANPKAFISVLDPKDTIIKKFKSAVTDSGAEVVYAKGKDGINNLLTIYSLVTDKTVAEAEKEFVGKGYGDFKQAVGEAVAARLAPVQQEFERLMAEKAHVEEAIRLGAEKALGISARTLQKAYKKVGFLAR